MAKYVILVNWTEKGVQEAKGSTDRSKQVASMVQSLGGTMETILWTLGRYDIVAICDAPDDETAASIGLKVAGLGTVRTETMRAFTAEELGDILGKLG